MKLHFVYLIKFQDWIGRAGSGYLATVIASE